MFVKDKKDRLINFRVTQEQKDIIDFMCNSTNEKQTELIMRLLQNEYKKILAGLEK